MPRMQFFAVFLFSFVFSSAFAHNLAEEKIQLIGIISFDTPFLGCQRGLEDGLKQLGYGEQRVQYVIHDLKKDLSKVPGIVREFQRQHCALIVTTSTPVTLHVKKALEKGQPIPLIFTMVADPVGSKIVPSLQVPGGSITGINYNAFAMIPKRLELFREAFPAMKRIAVFYNHGEDWISDAVEKFLLPTAKSLNLHLVSYDVRSHEDMAAAEHDFDNSVEGIFMVPDPLAISFYTDLVKLSHDHKLPIMVVDNILLEKGGVLGYSPTFYSIGIQASFMAAKVLAGTSPGRLSVQNPLDVRLVVSLKEANRLGLSLSESFLSYSDDIIR